MTQFLSKRMEKLLIKWIWKFIYPHIGADQLGFSIVHYVIRMMDFILKNQDKGEQKDRVKILGTAVLKSLHDLKSQANPPVFVVTCSSLALYQV